MDYTQGLAFVFTFFVGSLIGFVVSHSRTLKLLQQQKRNIFNMLLPYVLGEGRAAQVVVKLEFLERALMGDFGNGS